MICLFRKVIKGDYNYTIHLKQQSINNFKKHNATRKANFYTPIKKHTQQMEPKYKLLEIVYFIHENKIQKGKIVALGVAPNDHTKIEYLITLPNEIKSQVKLASEVIFYSKEDLIEYLLQDADTDL